MKLNKKEQKILLQEYIESSQDWRHRDNMLWNTFSLVIALTAATFAYVFGTSSTLEGQVLVLFSALLLSFLSILKITKDQYYQQGSEKYSRGLIKLITGKELYSIIGKNLEYNEKFNPRIPRGGEILSLPFYPWIKKASAFNFFYISNLILLLIIAILLFTKIMELINVKYCN